ncbi:hypothetical protein [Desulfobacter vibrioformis]|uniref:hypothetical protein n=1 Tax=Desulfobacter vibrioformis TaxID=34031 RepID=UPI0005562C43|nr:hypothetical protein [Desulfobacter vibrioformis]
MNKRYVCVQALLLLVFGVAAQGMCQPAYTLKQLCRMANKNAETIWIAREQVYIQALYLSILKIIYTQGDIQDYFLNED